MWKFNNSLLKDKKYVEYINKVIDESFLKYNEIQDKGLCWEMIKMEIRSSTLMFAKNKAREKREQIVKMMHEVSRLEGRMNNGPSQEEIERYYGAQKEIESFNIEKANGVLIRSKADQVEFGEKNTGYFLNMEKRNAGKKCITKLLNENGEDVVGQKEILEYEEAFYKKLYQNPDQGNEPQKYNNARDFFMDGNVPSISDEQKIECDQEITESEIGKSLLELKNGRSPGSDGLTTDFYKFFWGKLKGHVLCKELAICV
jgi:hypothetical protein